MKTGLACSLGLFWRHLKRKEAMGALMLGKSKNSSTNKNQPESQVDGVVLPSGQSDNARLASELFPSQSARPLGHRISIPDEECTISFARSGGNGGQNVNKVETKAVIHWNPTESATLTFREKERIVQACEAKDSQGLSQGMKRLRQLMNSEGSIVVNDSSTRHQLSNKERALEKLSTLVSEALKEEKPRKPTKPSKTQKAKRVDDKTQHGKKKASRGQNKRGDWD
jgi:ribosome-associated protein